MTTSRQRMATGGYGEASAARHLVEQGMVVLDRNWRCEQGEIDLVLRDGEVLVFCEVKTRASAAYGAPLEAVTPTKARPAAPARRPVDAGARAPRPRRAASTWSACCLDRGGEARLEHVARGGLMPFATDPHGGADRCDRPPGRRAGRRRRQGTGRDHAGRPPRRVGQRGAGPLPDGGHQQPASAGRPPGGSRSCSRPADLPKRGSHFDLAIAVAVLAADGASAAAPSSTGRSFVGELTLDGRLRAVPGVLPMVLAAPHAGHRPRHACPSPRRGEAAMVPGMEVLGFRSLAQAVARARGRRRCPTRRPSSRCRAPGCSPGAATGGRGARPRRPRTAWRTPASPSRSPRPGATTCCSAGRRGRARPPSPSGSPGCSPTSPSRSRSS